jgi:3-hydroxyisobutyrate dehydrogenase
MALNLARAGTKLVVSNRTAVKCAPLEALGAERVEDASEVFPETSVVILMLANERAIDSVLLRGSESFAALVRGVARQES